MANGDGMAAIMVGGCVAGSPPRRAVQVRLTTRLSRVESSRLSQSSRVLKKRKTRHRQFHTRTVRSRPRTGTCSQQVRGKTPVP